MKSDEVIGGPKWTTRICPACRASFKYHSGGSWDHKPQLCKDCKSAQLDADLYREAEEKK